MDVQSTILAMAAAAAIGLFCGWRGARQWTVIEGPRMIPWRFITLLAFAGFLFLGKHLIDLFRP
jgi:hypothetical protein